MTNLNRLKEKRKLYSGQLRKAQRPDRIKVILNAIDEEIKEAKRKEAIMA